MTWVATGLVLAAGGTALNYEAAGDAADASERGSRAGIAETRRQFDTIVGLNRPNMVTGTGAMNMFARLMGLPYAPYQDPVSAGAGGGYGGGNKRLENGGQRFSNRKVNKLLKQGYSVDDITKMGYLGGRLNPGRLRRLERKGVDADEVQQLMSGVSASEAAANAPPGIVTPDGPDMSVFQESPDYQIRLREGSEAIDRSAAARGGALSGNAVRANTEFASDEASSEYGNFVSRLLAAAGIGTGATNTVSNAAANTGNQVGQRLADIGTARASGVLGQANSISNGVNSGLSNWLLYRGGYFDQAAA